MSRLHKTIRISLVKKMYVLLFCFVLYGWYKNGLLPVINHYYSNIHLLVVFAYPVLGFVLGFIFDFLSKSQNEFSNAFYGLLFSMVIPISTSLWLFAILLFLLFLFNTFFFSKKEIDFHFLAFWKFVLIGILFFLKQYQYENLLEQSHLFVYSFLDGVLGHNSSGLFTSNVLLILISFFILALDAYYKKEIPLYSYGVYLLSLLFYSIYQKDMTILLTNMLSSTVLFALVFFAPLSTMSPYSRKRKVMYSILLGVLILPISLYINFYEGVYISLILVSFLNICLNTLQNRLIYKKK